jgi:hypothetical protein
MRLGPPRSKGPFRLIATNSQYKHGPLVTDSLHDKKLVSYAHGRNQTIYMHDFRQSDIPVSEDLFS